MRRLAYGLFLMALATACGGQAPHDHGRHGAPSGAECPAGSSLTYANFGKSFMDTYCTSCHASSRTGEQRDGAPADQNLDTLAGVREVGAQLIDRSAAAGPDHVNTLMPPDDHQPKPSQLERERLGEWLACGMP